MATSFPVGIRLCGTEVATHVLAKGWVRTLLEWVGGRFRPGSSAAIWTRCRQPGVPIVSPSPSGHVVDKYGVKQGRPPGSTPLLYKPPPSNLSFSSATSLSNTHLLCLPNNVPPSHVCCRFWSLVETRLTFVLNSSEGSVHNVCGHYIQTRVVDKEDCNSSQCRHSAQHRCRPGRRCECLQVSLVTLQQVIERSHQPHHVIVLLPG